MKKTFSILAALAIAMCVSSCYKIFGVTAPKEVKQGETFEVIYTIVDDGDANAKYLNDWSVAGLRVPDGWTVTVPANAYKGYAEDWVYLEEGAQANKKYPMKANETMTAYYNSTLSRKNYTWFGFQSRTKVPKDVRGCWHNGCDSITMTFKVTVPVDCKPGNYTIDFVGGDIENDGGIEAYESGKAAKDDSRAYHVGTFSHSYIDNKNTAAACKVTVVADEAAGINNVAVEEKSDAIYDLDGKKLKKPRKGVNIIDGKKVISNK